MKQYTSNALLVAGKPAVIKSNVCTLNTVEVGSLTGYWPRLSYCSLEESDVFQRKLRDVLMIWHIPFSIRHTVSLDICHSTYTYINPCYKDEVERILCMYYQVSIDC